MVNISDVSKIIVSTFTREVKVEGLYISEMVCKYDGYQYMKIDLGLPVAGIMLCYYYENMLNGEIKLQHTERDTYGFGEYGRYVIIVDICRCESLIIF